MRIFGFDIVPAFVAKERQAELDRARGTIGALRTKLEMTQRVVENTSKSLAARTKEAYQAKEELKQRQLADRKETGDIREQLIRGDNIRASEAKFRAVREVNQHLRKIMGQCIVTVESVCNKRPNQVTAEHLEDLKHEVNKMRHETILPNSDYNARQERLAAEDDDSPPIYDHRAAAEKKANVPYFWRRNDDVLPDDDGSDEPFADVPGLKEPL